MKKFLAAIASAAMIAVCSTAAFADDAAVGDSTVQVGASSTETGAGNENVPTGVVLTAGPLALAAGALVVSGIVLKKKSK